MSAYELPKVGSTLGRYRLEEQIGSGAMGVVFRAHDTLLDATVCIKVLSPSAGRASETLARFRREAVLARRITHPGVCRLFDLHEENGVQFLTMEYIDGKMLRDAIVDDGSLDITVTMRILEGLASALGAAWTVGVVHRDLKPRNIMIRKDGSPCILDFGIATAGDVDGLTRPGIALGTMHYIAPEVWQGQTATHQSDLYALGIIGYNCLTGRMPFRSDDGGLLDQMRTTRPPPPSQFRRGVPRELDELILSLIAFEPHDRPADAKIVQRVLRDLLRARGVDSSTMLDGATLSTNDTGLPAMAATSSDTETTDDKTAVALPPSWPSSGTRVVAPSAVHPDERATTKVTTSPRAIEETMAPREAVPLPPDASSHAALRANGSEEFSHSFRIDGVTQHDHVAPAAITRSPAAGSTPQVVDVHGSVQVHSRMPMVAAGLLVSGLIVGGVFVWSSKIEERSERTAALSPQVGVPMTTVVDMPFDIPTPPRPIAPPSSTTAAVVNDMVADDAESAPLDAGEGHVVIEETAGETEVHDVARPPVIAAAKPAHATKPTRTSSRRVDDGTRARIEGALSSVRRAEQSRGIMRGDLPKLDNLWGEMRKDEKRLDTESATAHVAEALRVIEAARIDKSFIDVKLARFNTRFDKTSDVRAKERATPVMTDVLRLKSQSRFDDANRRLNDGFRLLGQKG